MIRDADTRPDWETIAAKLRRDLQTAGERFSIEEGPPPPYLRRLIGDDPGAAVCCPRHRHHLSPAARDGKVVWECPNTEQAVAEFGELANGLG